MERTVEIFQLDSEVSRITKKTGSSWRCYNIINSLLTSVLMLVVLCGFCPPATGRSELETLV